MMRRIFFAIPMSRRHAASLTNYKQTVSAENRYTPGPNRVFNWLVCPLLLRLEVQFEGDEENGLEVHFESEQTLRDCRELHPHDPKILAGNDDENYIAEG